MWSDLCGDLRYATRLLLQHRGFAAAALLTIALGVGAATAIFSVVDAVLLRPLPYPDARRLVAVWETDRNSGTLREPASLPDMLDMRRQFRRLDAVGGVIPDELNFTPRGGEPQRLASLLITSELLPLLGARPVLGRLFTDDEQRAGTFACAGCDQDLFASTAKFNSGTGWPSFTAPIEGGVGTSEDRSFFMVRTEVNCSRCGGHIGHVFDDGPPPTGLRYCMNGVAMKFIPAQGSLS